MPAPLSLVDLLPGRAALVDDLTEFVCVPLVDFLPDEAPDADFPVAVFSDFVLFVAVLLDEESLLLRYLIRQHSFESPRVRYST